MSCKTKEGQAASARKHYLKNREAMIARALTDNKKRIQRNKDFVFNYLSEHPCVDCGEGNPIVLEFDHISNDKFKEISNLVQEAYSLERIKLEIAKCEVRCANCHRIVTHNRRIGS